jgi:hypothetical protein
MPGFTDYALQGLMPAIAPWLAKTAPVSLPVGGQVGSGAEFPLGQALGVIGGVAQSEVRTITITANGATGLTGYFTYHVPDGNLIGLTATGGITGNSVTAFPTAAQVQAALVAAVIPWNGNVTVTGSTGGPYTLTFNSYLTKRRIGGLLTFTVQAATGGPPTVAITTATQGSSGASQADVYSQASNNSVDAFLQYAARPGPLGSELTEYGSTNLPFNGYTAWVKGIFNVGATGSTVNPTGGAGVIGLDANAMTLKKLVFDNGQALTDVGVRVEMI